MTTGPLFVGVDPDTHNCAFAFVDDTPRVVAVVLARVDKTKTGRGAVVSMAVAIRHLFEGTRTDKYNEHVKAVAVESQEVSYSAAGGVPPGDLIPVAAVAGAAIFAGSLVWNCPILHPSPQQWKGSVPKQIHQVRILKKLGLEYTRAGNLKNPSKGYCVPVLLYDIDAAKDIKKSDWKHLVDAMGLAMHARDTYRYAKSIGKAV